MNRLLSNTHKLYLCLWFAILFFLPLSIKLSSITISFSVLVFVLLSINKSISFKKKQFLYFLPLLIFFVVHIFSMSTRITDPASIKEIEQLLSLLAVPALIILGGVHKNEFSITATKALFYSVIVGSLIMLIQSYMDFRITRDFNEFIYHSLTEPLRSGAVFFSFYIVIVLLRIEELNSLFVNKKIAVLSIGFLTIMLFLLASKMMLAVGIILFVFKQKKWILKNLPFAKIVAPVLIILMAVLMIPVGQRFSKLIDPRLDIVMDDSFTYDSPLNGLNLRLIQARLGFEILHEQEAWIFGVGSDRSQKLLNQKYIEKGIYTGYKNTDDIGYLDYNFHNQYIETTVRSGIIGLIALLTIIYMVLKTPSKYLFASKWEISLILIFFITESVIERQVGIVYFCIMYAAYFPNLKSINKK
jgi:O-antigen ligase